nr:hypothetical protein [Paracoccus saliphilus]
MRSIRGRLLILAAVWLTAALLGAFLVIAHLLKDFLTDRFDAETAAIADSLIGQLAVDPDDRVGLEDAPPNGRYTLPFSGSGTGRCRRMTYRLHGQYRLGQAAAGAFGRPDRGSRAAGCAGRRIVV